MEESVLLCILGIVCYCHCSGTDGIGLLVYTLSMGAADAPDVDKSEAVLKWTVAPDHPAALQSFSRLLFLKCFCLKGFNPLSGCLLVLLLTVLPLLIILPHSTQCSLYSCTCKRALERRQKKQLDWTSDLTGQCLCPAQCYICHLGNGKCSIIPSGCAWLVPVDPIARLWSTAGTTQIDLGLGRHLFCYMNVY